MTTASLNAQGDVLQALKHANEPLTVSTLVAETILGETTVRTALKALIAAGDVSTSKVGQTTMFSFVKKAAPVPPAPEAPPLPEPPSGRKTSNKNTTAKRPGPHAGVRHEAAQARDLLVRTYLEEHPMGFHRRDLAKAMDVDYNLLYISLWRLEREGVITKSRDGSRSPVWKIKTDGK